MNLKLGVSDFAFQYGPVIKLPLHISQCHMVNHMALTNAKRLLNIDQSDNSDTTILQVFLVNLLLNPIGMLIPILKSHGITSILYEMWPQMCDSRKMCAMCEVF